MGNGRPQFIFYGGKGGVGKTTCAAARALAEAARGARVLVASTDPAHSLGDALKIKLSGRVTKVAGALYAVELDARRAFSRWLSQHRRPLGDLLEQGTWLDREDVDALLDLSIPGIDELVGLLELTRLAQSGVADVIVVDTAPTGHTLRLLASPDTVGAVARVLDALHEQHRIIRDQLARVRRPEATDRLIELLAGQAREMAGRLRDRRQTTVHWVTLPEDLSVSETGDAVTSLERSAIHVDEIIVNRVLPGGSRCDVCDRRRALEARAVATIRKQLGRGRRVRGVAAQVREPVGVTVLRRIGKELLRSQVARLKRRPAERVGVGHRFSGAGSVAAETLAAFAGAKFLFFGGKGGVGKTTVAAAAAVRLAAADPNRRVLLLSTDPAHSLADVFAARIGDTPSAVAGALPNLRVRELDAPAAWTVRRAAVESALEEIASTFGAGTGDSGARVSELMDLAPPGVDELFGMLSVFEARDEYDLVLIDTAPTGHALRLLAMPDVVRDWVQALLRMMLKYRSVVRPQQLAAELVAISRSVRQLNALLQNPRETRFLIVTRAADVPLAETDRLLRRLRRMKLAVPAIAVNAMTLSPDRCAWCRVIASDERRRVSALRRSMRRGSRGCAIIQTPLSAPPPRGVEALTAWGARWGIANC